MSRRKRPYQIRVRPTKVYRLLTLSPDIPRDDMRLAMLEAESRYVDGRLGPFLARVKALAA